MPDEQPSITLTKQDFDDLQWQDVPSADADGVFDYSNPYYERAADAATRGDAHAAARLGRLHERDGSPQHDVVYVPLTRTLMRGPTLG